MKKKRPYISTFETCRYTNLAYDTTMLTETNEASDEDECIKEIEISLSTLVTKTIEDSDTDEFI